MQTRCVPCSSRGQAVPDPPSTLGLLLTLPCQGITDRQHQRQSAKLAPSRTRDLHQPPLPWNLVFTDRSSKGFQGFNSPPTNSSSKIALGTKHPDPLVSDSPQRLARGQESCGSSSHAARGSGVRPRHNRRHARGPVRERKGAVDVRRRRVPHARARWVSVPACGSWRHGT